MALDLVDYEQKAHEAVKALWGNREAARQKQIESGKADQGESGPFVGWLMMVEDAPKSRCAVRDASPHFPVFKEFKGASYLMRQDSEHLLRRWLVILPQRSPGLGEDATTLSKNGFYYFNDHSQDNRSLAFRLKRHIINRISTN